jgi:hypothetical protein
VPFEFIAGAVIGAAAASPRVRNTVRQGLIYGLGSVLVTYDKVTAGANAAVQAARQATAATKEGNAVPKNGTAASSENVAPNVEPAAASPH